MSLLLSLVFTSCTITRYPGERDGRDREIDRKDRDEDRGDRNEGGRNFPFSALNIPKGHLPQPGECKIWIPGKDYGQQGPPQSCGSALRNAPLVHGWLLMKVADTKSTYLTVADETSLMMYGIT